MSNFSFNLKHIVIKGAMQHFGVLEGDVLTTVLCMFL